MARLADPAAFAEERLSDWTQRKIVAARTEIAEFFDVVSTVAKSRATQKHEEKTLKARQPRVEVNNLSAIGELTRWPEMSELERAARIYDMSENTLGLYILGLAWAPYRMNDLRKLYSDPSLFALLILMEIASIKPTVRVDDVGGTKIGNLPRNYIIALRLMAIVEDNDVPLLEEVARKIGYGVDAKRGKQFIERQMRSGQKNRERTKHDRRNLIAKYKNLKATTNLSIRSIADKIARDEPGLTADAVRGHINRHLKSSS